MNCLHFLEPRSFIQGGPDIFVEEAGTMNITCLVLDSPKPPEFIFWYHNDQVIVTIHLLYTSSIYTFDVQYQCHASHLFFSISTISRNGFLRINTIIHIYFLVP